MTNVKGPEGPAVKPPDGTVAWWKRCRFCGAHFDRVEEAMVHRCERDVRAAERAHDPFMSVDIAGAVLRFLYTHNPFYLISAGLVLLGLNAAFGASADTANAWTLMAVLAGYTALIAGTTLLVVRLGKVWADARSMLLVIVILLVALSVNFDEVLVRTPATGRWLLALGLAFSVAASELVLGVLRIRMRAWFRAPFYAMLALFFAYPVVLQPILNSDDVQQIPAQWGTFLFPVFAALVLLMLLPAVRRGAEYARDNGTPWRWPWFPWPLFVLLGFGMCARSYYLTLSFHVAHGYDSIFGLYFLTPIILAAAVVLLEIGIVAGKRGVMTAALVLPLIAILISLTGEGGTEAYTGFLATYRRVFGLPVFTAAVAAALFYLYACVRRAWLALPALVVALMAAAIAMPKPEPGHPSAVPGTLPQALPLVLAGLVLIWLAIRWRRSLFAFFAMLFLVGAAAVGLRGTWFLSAYGAIPYHLAYVGMLLIAALFRDKAARALQSVAAALLPWMVLLDIAAREEVARLAGTQAAPWLYLAAVLVLPFLYGWWVRNLTWLGVGIADTVIAGSWGVWLLCSGLVALHGPKVAWPLAGSVLAFLVALAISLSKVSGIMQKVGDAVTRPYRPRPTPGP